MPEIRPLERADLSDVAALLRANLELWSGDPDDLSASFLDCPWADEELPSYVAVDERGKVCGFIGSQARRLRFGDREIRGVSCTQLAVDPVHRNGATGALIVGRLLAGPQELTWSDSATDLVARVWSVYGGHVDHPRACDWLLVARPRRWLSNLAGAMAKRRSVRRDLAPVGALPFHAAGPRLARRAFPTPPGDVAGEDATAETLVAHLPEIAADLSVWVDHDQQQLSHVFGLLNGSGGPLVRRLVRRRGQPIGWYAYRPRPGGVSRVLHVACSEQDAGVVLGELVAHATESGSAAIAGRAEPHLTHCLSDRFAVLGYARTPIIHVRDPELAAELSTGASLLTRLDGELTVT